jgi:hypothetical protein
MRVATPSNRVRSKGICCRPSHGKLRLEPRGTFGAVTGYRVCRMHGARGGAPEGKRNGNFRHGGGMKETIRASRYLSPIRLNNQVRNGPRRRRGNE